ncbi:hypothetical protein ASPZODRAFT_187431 [Penicilliopsis zonata CBS 506.65]|uniref:RNA polymerase II transcription factor SIII subunit A n=1 Tax=Penicilliopsis zonata CBS 506.65 TaxID=1073090 RepID=A0A1L9STF0_9EURO|nr:hypothetical protein ASPZODRAFT_187431 [Penicilliopsis zonata CBS 506.65]OJJ50479.1 hypothetical protein ASPZODRAFT_187431 [Penicilliopsis zonata CBS 506.65]
MPSQSLLQLCTATAIRNARYLTDIGSVPYVLARPFLLKIESPEKLRSLELLSPHIAEEDSELWLEFIKRDIPNWESYDLPENPDCWYDVYCGLRDHVQQAVEKDAEQLKVALQGITSEREKNSAKLVSDHQSARLPLPRPSLKQRLARSSLSRETKKKSNIFAPPKRNSALSVPTKNLSSRASRVQMAPRSLVEAHRHPDPPPEPPVSLQRKPLSASPSLLTSSASGRSVPANRTSSLERPQSAMTRESGTAQVSTHNKTPSIRGPSLRPFPEGRGSTSRTVPSRNSTGEESKSTKADKSAGTAAPPPSLDDSEFKPAPAQAARPVMRKRPAPSVFIQPKKKRAP